MRRRKRKRSSVGSPFRRLRPTTKEVYVVRVRCWYCEEVVGPLAMDGRILACGDCGRLLFVPGSEHVEDVAGCGEIEV